MNQKLLLGSALLVGMASTQQALARQKKAKEQTRPNVVFILADDLGYGDLSCYGQEKFETPNIDRLAQNGMRFTQCYSGTTVSAPSRSCLITGTHSGHTAIRGNKELAPKDNSHCRKTHRLFSMISVMPVIVQVPLVNGGLAISVPRGPLQTGNRSVLRI